MEVVFEIAMKYHLVAGESYDDERWHRMISENTYQQALNQALFKLRKMMTLFEIKQYLEDQGYPQSIVKQVTHHLIERRYIDDVRYAEDYLSIKKMSEGPEMMLYKLRQKGISEPILEHLFHGYKEDDVIKVIAEQKWYGLKHKTKRQALMTIKQHLLQKGFHREAIERILISTEEDMPSHDDDLIEKAYDKAYLHLSKKWSGYELEMKIKEKLYQKGFSYPTIQAILEKKKLQSW